MRVWTSTLAVAAGALLLAPSAQADLPAGSFVFDGSVTEIAAGADGTYLGGYFTRQQAVTGGLIAVNADGTAATPAMPRVAGTITDIVPDGAGGYFIGGEFSRVGAVSRSRLAHILPDGTVDPTFDPAPNGRVRALALSAGTLYVGGDFTTIGGQSRNLLAALDAATGVAKAWNPSPSEARCCGVVVSALAVSGTSVYVGGDFGRIGGQPRFSLAEIDAAGNATAFNAQLATVGGPEVPVTTLAVAGGKLYVGGALDSVAGQPRNGLAAIALGTGAVDAWNPAPQDEPDAGFWGPRVNHLQIAGNTAYLAGDFVAVGGQPRAAAAAVDLTTGNATAFAPAIEGNVVGLAVSGTTVYVAGNLGSVNGEPRSGAAALTAATGAPLPWDPNPNGEVEAIATTGTRVVLGGGFTGAGPNLATVDGLARLNPDGSLDTDFAPQPDGRILALVSAGGVVYAAGEFTTLGGQPRNGLGAVNAATGAVTAWNPAAGVADVRVDALAAAGGTIYVGGRFDALGGQPRRNLAAIGTNGGATAFAPNPDDFVGALAVAGNRVFAGGAFTSIGGRNRASLASVDATTGLATDFNAAPNDSVDELAVSGDTVYAVGFFSQIGGANRSRFAALNATTGAATPLNLNIPYGVDALAASGTRLYLGGWFGTVAGQPRSGFAAVDTTSGTVTPLEPAVAGTVDAVAVFGQAVHLGGSFSAVDGEVAGGYARLTDAGAEPVDTTAPETTLTGGPAETVTTSAVSFTFSAGEPGSTFECAYDGQPFAACISPATLTGLANGVHTFSVRATDRAGNTDATPATVTFMVAVPAPTDPGSGTTRDPDQGAQREPGQGTTTNPAPSPGGNAAPPPAVGEGSSAAAVEAALRDALKRPSTTVKSLLKKGTVSAKFTAPAPGTMTIEWRVGKTVVAKGSKAAAKAGATSVSVKLSSAGRRLFKKARKPVKVTVAATFRPKGGAAAKRTGSIKVRVR